MGGGRFAAVHDELQLLWKGGRALEGLGLVHIGGADKGLAGDPSFGCSRSSFRTIICEVICKAFLEF